MKKGKKKKKRWKITNKWQIYIVYYIQYITTSFKNFIYLSSFFSSHFIETEDEMKKKSKLK